MVVEIKFLLFSQRSIFFDNSSIHNKNFSIYLLNHDISSLFKTISLGSRPSPPCMAGITIVGNPKVIPQTTMLRYNKKNNNNKLIKIVIDGGWEKLSKILLSYLPKSKIFLTLTAKNCGSALRKLLISCVSPALIENLRFPFCINNGRSLTELKVKKQNQKKKIKIKKN